MSYNIQITLQRDEVAFLHDRVVEAFNLSGQAESQRQVGTWTETMDAIAAQCIAAQPLIDSLPSSWAELFINFSGHCEPASGQRDGWGADFRNTNIAIKSFKPKNVDTNVFTVI
jgi:hypothetical protein